MDIFNELRELRDQWRDYEVLQEHWDILRGEVYPGCKVAIYWKQDSESHPEDDQVVDFGYVFIVDGMDEEIGDCFVHIPTPDNSGGKDNAPPEWLYMIQLLANPFVEKIVCQ